MSLDKFAGIRLARTAQKPEKIVVSDGNDVVKPGDHIATCTDPAIAEELVYLWNEGIKAVSIEEAQESTDEIEAFIEDVRNTLEGPEGKPTKDTLILIASIVDKEQDILEVLEEAGLVGSFPADEEFINNPVDSVREHFEKRRVQLMEEAEKRLERLLKSSLEEGLLNNTSLVKLFVGAFRDEVDLVERLQGKLTDEDNDLKKILAHIRNKIVTEKQ